MTREQLLINKCVEKLATMMIRNGGRWCEIAMKKSGKKYTVVRDGYGPMEYPERDKCHIKDENKNVLYASNDLYGMSAYIIENLR